MLLWVSVAAMTVMAIAGVLWPLFRKRPARSGSDAIVYRDQLQEIDRDLGLGLIGAKEAEAARIEVSRRLLGATDQVGEVAAETGWSFGRSAVAGLALVLLTAGSSALYLRLGSPSMAETRVVAAPEATGIDKLVGQAEEYLTQHPQEARGWEVLAPVYMRLGRYSDSANAWRNVLQLSGENADRLANLGEALTAEANGVVTADAKDVFVRSVALDPTTVTAQFYLGIAAEQDGKNADAAKIFKDLIAHAPADAHWMSDVRSALARVDGKPDGAPVAAAQNSAPSNPQDNIVIRGMVEGLAERLKKDGSDPEGWVRLVRSYGVLNQPDKKTAAIADARKALAGDAEKLAKFEKELSALSSDTGASSPPPAVSQQAIASSTAASAPGGDPMVRGMVDRLAARMKQDGSDPQGWVKLVQSYGVLNDAEKKQAAITDARKALGNDSEKLAKFESGLAALEKGEPLPGDVAAPPHSATNATAAAGVADDPSVRGMVGRLATRLKQDGSDVDGWIKLIRSYKVMNDDAATTVAVADARKALAGDATKLAKLETGIKAIDAGQEPPPPEPPAAGAAAAGPDHNADDMVQRLAERLQRSGSDPEGWLMLVRSYSTLKEPDKQKTAITNARTALASEPAKLDAFNDAIKRFKLE